MWNLTKKLSRSGSKAGGSSSSSSSGAESTSKPPPKKTYRPFGISSAVPFGSFASKKSNPASPSKPSSVAPVARQPSTLTPTFPPTLHDGPGTTLDRAFSNKAQATTVVGGSDSDSSSLPDSPVLSTRQQVARDPTLSSDDEPKRSVTATSRAKVQIERDLNTMRSEFEGLKGDVNGQLNRMEKRQVHLETQQSLVLEKLDTLIQQTSEARVAARTNATVKDAKPDPTEQQESDEYFELGSQIQGRRDHDKALEQFLNEHVSRAQALTRSVARSLFGVKKLTADATPLYYKNGRPDFFPKELTDRNGYCKPYPHWDRSFADNYPWFSVYLSLWRSMIPKESSAFETACRGFTDRQILVLLHDGPFKSLVTGWNTKKKEGGVGVIEGSKGVDKEEEKAIKRGVSRTEAKTFVRVSYRPEIKKIAGPKWNPMWVKPTMSPEPSDGEGGKLVLRPLYRARWVNTVYTTIDNAERAKELAKPGVHRPPAKRTIQLVDSMPPVLYIGTGDDKKVDKYPLAMLSKQWRATKQGADWMKASAHLIDQSLSERPSISHFVKAHPPPVAGKSKVEGDVGVEQEVAYEGEDEDEGEAEVEVEGARQGEVEVEGEGEGESEGESEGEGEAEYMEVSNAWNGGDFPIDPELPIQSPTQSAVYHPRPRVTDADYIPVSPSQPPPQSAGMGASLNPSTPSMAATPNEAIGYPSELQQHPPRPIWPDPAAPMPPPPTLSQQAAAATATPTPEPPKQRRKRTKAQSFEQGTLGPSTSTQDLNAPEEPPMKRRRGRPPGSKNKKTLEKERLAAESQQ